MLTSIYTLHHPATTVLAQVPHQLRTLGHFWNLSSPIVAFARHPQLPNIMECDHLFPTFANVCTDTNSCKRSSTPPPAEDAQQQPPVCPQTPGAPRDVLPRTMIPPSPGGPRLNALATHPKRSARIRAPPAGSKRSHTAGVKKPALKATKTKINVVPADVPIAHGKTMGFKDLPGGEVFSASSESRLTTSRDPQLDLLLHCRQFASSPAGVPSSARITALTHSSRPPPYSPF